MRLFAVGDADQSIYGFLDGEPDLLERLGSRTDVELVRLQFNYRCSTSIMDASQAALGLARSYVAPSGTARGSVSFHAVDGDYDAQASFVVDRLIPHLAAEGISAAETAILYREAWIGKYVAAAARAQGLPFIRADREALVARGSPLSRLVEDCACWVSGGWREARPRFRELLSKAERLIYAGATGERERQILDGELVAFLQATHDSGGLAHDWLARFQRELVDPWKERSANPGEKWDAVTKMIAATAYGHDEAMLPLSQFGGAAQVEGRLTLSTLHSAKGREFDGVILFGINDRVFPGGRDRSPKQLREARRLLYVAITRARKHVAIVYRKGAHSPWLAEVHNRSR